MLDFSSVQGFRLPFHYFLSRGALTADAALRTLEWLETYPSWTLVETDFYEQYEFTLNEIELPEPVSFLRERSFLETLRQRVASLFSVDLEERIDSTVHKLISGQRIRVHNDFIPGQETHRVVINLNRGWHDANGGLLLFFNSSDAFDIHRILRPIHNTSVAFAISHDSLHAVSTVHNDERFSLVYSFYGRTGL
jgi:Rps23 Pro-64 3,4-dihydroxylase Tpa1-like proline 4-hydroxylase